MRVGLVGELLGGGVNVEPRLGLVRQALDHEVHYTLGDSLYELLRDGQGDPRTCRPVARRLTGYRPYRRLWHRAGGSTAA
jgi:hypothetical protein